MRKRVRSAAASWAVAVLTTGATFAGSLTPPAGPGSTMKTLQELYDEQAAIHLLVDTLASPLPFSSATTVVAAGYHPATDLRLVETNLSPAHIRSGVSIFGVTGTYVPADTYQAGLQKTGQTEMYRTGDDGDLEKGVAAPIPRFTDPGDGTVADNLTGLVWVKAPHALPGNAGILSWTNAVTFCDNLTFAGHTDWRLPNVLELQSLLDLAHYAPALPAGHPFTGSVDYCWSSTSCAFDVISDGAPDAWGVSLYYGYVTAGDKAFAYEAWPVRGGP